MTRLSPVAAMDDRPWFEATFSSERRAHLRQTFQPLGLLRSPESLLVGEAFEVIENLSQMLEWVANPRGRDGYAVPMLRRLIELMGHVDLDAVRGVEKLHFVYQSVIECSYKLRDREPSWLDVVVWAANCQVAMAERVAAAMSVAYPGTPLPSHRGYERLAILAEKAGDDAEVMRLSRRALDQGWSGSWERRIAKAHRRAAR